MSVDDFPSLKKKIMFMKLILFLKAFFIFIQVVYSLDPQRRKLNNIDPNSEIASSIPDHLSPSIYEFLSDHDLSILSSISKIEYQKTFKSRGFRHVKKIYIQLFGIDAWKQYDKVEKNPEFYRIRKDELLITNHLFMNQTQLATNSPRFSSGLRLHSEVFTWYAATRLSQLNVEPIQIFTMNEYFKNTMSNFQTREGNGIITSFKHIKQNILDILAYVVLMPQPIIVHNETHFVAQDWDKVSIEMKIDILLVYYTRWRVLSLKYDNGIYNFPLISTFRYLLKETPDLHTFKSMLKQRWLDHREEYLLTPSFTDKFYECSRDPIMEIDGIFDLLQSFRHHE
jgi:hypothetical protein